MARDDEHPSPGKEPEQSVLQQLAPFLTSGFQLAVTVVIFFFAGRWLDGQVHTAPWCMIVLTFIGISGGLYKFIRVAVQLGKREDEQWKAEKHGRKKS